jgi:multisubunit Na+/H+ antiporter MnhG subunit
MVELLVGAALGSYIISWVAFYRFSKLFMRLHFGTKTAIVMAWIASWALLFFLIWWWKYRGPIYFGKNEESSSPRTK